MINAGYVGLSAQLALQQRLDTIANNMANSTVSGFRAEHIRFTTNASRTSIPTTDFSTAGRTYLSMRVGEIVRTEGALDVAVDGNAWFGVETPQGTAYSRDGRFQITHSGELRTLTGHRVLDVGGSPILLDANGAPPSIARDGTITQGARRIGTIGLFALSADAMLSRGVDATVLSDQPGQPVADSPTIGMRQGFVERSNVNPVVELSRLIMDQRLFEAVTNALTEGEQTQQSAIRTLGSSS